MAGEAPLKIPTPETSRPPTAALERNDTEVFMRVADLTLPFKRNAETSWIVGLDGSLLSFRCLRLAAMMMRQDGKHNLVALNLVSPGDDENVVLMNKAEDEVRRTGLLTWKYFGKKTLAIRKLSLSNR